MSSSATEAVSRPAGSWTRFSIRTLLMLTLLCGVTAAWWSTRVRRQEREDRAIQLLRAAPNELGEPDFNPIALVRAVNHLHAMGKDDAIKAMRRFAKENPDDGSPLSPHQSLELVARLLFDRNDPEDRYPAAFAFDPPGSFRWSTEQWTTWLAVEEDIPFHRVPLGGFSGQSADCTYLMQWAEHHARLRGAPLRPSDFPLRVADALLKRLEDDSELTVENRPWISRHVREQALRSIAQLLPRDEQDESKWHLHEDAEWNRLKARTDLLRIRWSEQRQEYTTTSGSQ